MNMYMWAGWALAMAIVLGVPALVVFFMVRVVRRRGVRGAAQAGGIGLGRLIKGTFEVIAAVLTGIVGIAGAASAAKGSAETPLSDTADSNEPWDLPGGSHYNSRTGRFDSGRDPGGTYGGLLGDNALPGPSSHDYWRED